MRSTPRAGLTSSFLMCQANASTTQGQPALWKCSNRSTRTTTNDWGGLPRGRLRKPRCWFRNSGVVFAIRSEEHTSELQSRGHLVCRLLLEKKKNYFVQNLLIFIVYNSFGVSLL